MTKVEQEVFSKALHTYGEIMQITIVFEEMSELQKELCKFLRGKGDGKTIAHIAEEIADVQIILDQMILLFDIADYVADFRKSKVLRLSDRLRRAENEVDQRKGQNAGGQRASAGVWDRQESP